LLQQICRVFGSDFYSFGRIQKLELNSKRSRTRMMRKIFIAYLFAIHS